MEPAEFIAFDLPSDSESDGEPFKKPEFVSISVLTPLPIPPWTDDPSKYPHEASHLLHQEILDYLKYVKPTDIEKSLREATLTNLKASILRILPNAKVNVFGSFATGLYLPSSDMDIVVSDRSICLPKILYELRTQFYKDNIAKSVEVIESAKIPIIKFVDENTGFKVDISFNMENGVIAAAMVNSFLSDPVHGRTVKALMLVLKQFLVQRYLNEVFTGGLGSYALLLMIVSFLKMHPKLQSKEIRGYDNLGVLLMEFFELYGKYFNYEIVGLGVTETDAWYYRKKDYGFEDYGSAEKLSIADPHDRSNDVSRGSYAIRKIKQEFAKAFRTLVAMFGVSYSTDGIIQPPTSSNTMVTLLGTILHVDRAILEHRDFLENFYYKLVTGLPSIPAPPQPKAVEFQKRKRQSDPHPEIIFIEDSTDNEKPRAKESKDLPRKKRKNAESERVAASEKSMGKKRAAASDSEDPDIAAYYGRNPNDKYLKETDGLDYSTHFDGPAFDGFNAPPASSPKKKKGKKSNPAKGKQKAKYNY